METIIGKIDNHVERLSRAAVRASPLKDSRFQIPFQVESPGWNQEPEIRNQEAWRPGGTCCRRETLWNAAACYRFADSLQIQEAYRLLKARAGLHIPKGF
jgi:hypothetical protein